MIQYISVFILILAILSYIYYRYKTRIVYTQLFKGPLELEGQYEDFVTNLELPESKVGNCFTYCFWIYFNNVPENSEWSSNFGLKKTILYRKGSPNVNYYPSEHTFQTSIAYKNKNGLTDLYNLDIDDLPIQQWVHCSIVLDNRIVSVYCDGILRKSGIIPNTPFLFNKNLNIGEENNNFNGALYEGRYYNRVLNQQQLTGIYNKHKDAVLLL